MMHYHSYPFSLMLIGTLLFNLSFAVISPQAHGAKVLGHWRHAARRQLMPTPTTKEDVFGSTVAPCSGVSCVAAFSQATDLPCNEVNGTHITAGPLDQDWVMLCDIDFFGQNIYPFILAGSFEKCLEHCNDHNQQSQVDRCAGFVFAPGRIREGNDCYLKKSLNDAVSPASIHLIGATLVPQSNPAVSTSNTAGPSTSYDNQPNENITSLTENINATSLGTSTNQPTKQYVSHLPALPVKLATTLLKPGINIDLVTNYPLASDTGSWTETSAPFDFDLANLTITPRLSRDGGKGGNINGTHIFIFCDTSTFGDVAGPLGYMNGFVSSSAAVDVSRNGLVGKALELEDPIGQWQDDVGRLRGWIQLTTGEEAFNVAISGQGYRYAIWPESSLIPLNLTHSLLYASVVYVEVDMQTQKADFTTIGNTLVVVSVDEVYGPHADRVVQLLFREGEVEWGTLGGIRAWTKSGRGTNDGDIYLFGNVDGGVLVAKVGTTNITDRDAYTYWDGIDWSATMPDKNSTAYMIDQPVMDMDIFYAPSYVCILMVYMTPFADNTFYIRQLNSKHAIIPPYEENGTDDYMEALVNSNWTEPRVLFKPEPPEEGYIYAGGCHLGYFGDDDIVNGGTKLLITWTEHTPVDPNDPASGYAHKSAVIDV